LEHAVEVDGADAPVWVVVVLQLQLALVADCGGAALGVVGAGLFEAVTVDQAGLAVAGVLVDLADQGCLGEPEQAGAGDGA
jgi:hypothetical protein